MFYRFLSLILFVTFILPSSTYSASTGAGVLPLFDDGTVLMGKETRYSNRLHKNIQVWSDFGGGTEQKDAGRHRKPVRIESKEETATREAKEETANTFKFTLNQVANSPYTDHNHPSGGSYRMYYVKVHGQKPSIADIHKNAKRLSWRRVEKSDWRYVPAQSLLNAVNTPPYTIPGTNEEIFAPTRAGLRQPTAQSLLRNLMNSTTNNPAPVVNTKHVGRKSAHERTHSHKARPARHAKTAHPKAKPARHTKAARSKVRPIRHTKAARSKVRPTRHTKANSRAVSSSKKQRISQRKAAHKPSRNRRAARRSR